MRISDWSSYVFSSDLICGSPDMRIVGGSHRGRAISAPPGDDTRPTSDRVRETLFNMLLHSPALLNREGHTRLEGGIVLDPFAGSGALSFEALSRGASHAYLFEIDALARRTILSNAAELKLADRITMRSADARQPGAPTAQADLIFLDPPYRSGLGSQALTGMDAHGWLKRSEERRGGKEGVSTCRSRWSPYIYKTKITTVSSTESNNHKIKVVR